MWGQTAEAAYVQAFTDGKMCSSRSHSQGCEATKRKQVPCLSCAVFCPRSFCELYGFSV